MMTHWVTFKIGPSLFGCEIEILNNVRIVHCRDAFLNIDYFQIYSLEKSVLGNTDLGTVFIDALPWANISNTFLQIFGDASMS